MGFGKANVKKLIQICTYMPAAVDTPLLSFAPDDAEARTPRLPRSAQRRGEDASRTVVELISTRLHTQPWPVAQTAAANAWRQELP